jgi:hypothetical protein
MQASTAGFALTWIFVGLVGAWGIFAAGELLDRTPTVGWSPVACALVPAREGLTGTNLRIHNRDRTDLSVLLVPTDSPSFDPLAPPILLKIGPQSAREVFLSLLPTELAGSGVQGVERELEADVTTVNANGLTLTYQVTCASSPAADLAG